MVFLNGTILGVHRTPLKFASAFRQLRRKGIVPEFVSVYIQHDAAYIASDNGRVCRPLIICDAGIPRLTQAHIAKVRFIDLPCCFFHGS